MASLSFGGFMRVLVLCYLLDTLFVSATQHRRYFPALSRPTPAGDSEACASPPNGGSRTEFWLPGSAATRLCAAAAATTQTTSSEAATTESGATGLLLGEVTRYMQQDRRCESDMPLASRTQQQQQQQQHLPPHQNEVRSGPRPLPPPLAAPDRRDGLPPPNDAHATPPHVHEEWLWDSLSDPHGVPDILLGGW